MGTGILYLALVMLALVLLVTAVIISKERIGVFIAVSIILIYTSESILNKRDAGRPAYPKVLVTGEKYEVVAIYEKYVIIKSATDDRLKFIGPLDFGTRTVTTGRYIKTAEGSLQKIE